MASWREQLQPASFRGVPFKVDGAEITGGRRLQVNEYPQRDKPFTEDLGRKAREISVTAFLVGDDYIAQRDRLLGAFEQGGEGELVHPSHGKMTVQVGEYRSSEVSIEGRLCRITFTCHESGDLTFPKASTNLQQSTSLAADSLDAATVAQFAEDFSLEGAEVVKVSALEDLQAALSDVEKATAWVGFAADIGKDLNRLIHDPRLLAERVLLGLSAQFPDLGRGRSLFSSITGLLRAGQGFDRHRGWQGGSTAYAAKTPVRVANNRAAMDGLFRQAAVSAASRAVVQPALPGQVYRPVFDEQKAIGQSIVQQLEREQVLAPDPLFRPLATLRQQVSAANKQDLVGAVRLATMTPVAVQPAVVIAYQLYQDARRGDEIAERNGVVHPGFVPAEPLKVLSK